MWLIYADESGDLGLTSASLAKDRWFLFGALCVEEAVRPVIDDHVVRLKRQFFGGQDPYSPDTEIKGSALHHFEDYVHAVGETPRQPVRRLRGHALSALSGDSVRSLRRSLFDLLDRISCRLYVVAIDKVLLVNRKVGPRFGPLAYAFPLIQMVDLCTYAVGKALRTGNWDDPWFKRVEPLLARNFSTGQPWAAGLTLYPKVAYPTDVRAALRRP